MTEARFLRKAGTSRIFIYTPELAERKDMVPHDPELALFQLKKAKEKREALVADIKARAKAAKGKSDPAFTETANELAKVEQDIVSLERERDKAFLSDEEQAEEEPNEKTLEKQREEKINSDPDVLRIKKMNLGEVEEYLAIDFGFTLRADTKVKEARQIAINKRTERIFETEV